MKNSNGYLSFTSGLNFAVLYFIFIPVLVLIFTGTVEVARGDFSQLIINDVVYESNITENWILIGYLTSILSYLVFRNNYPLKNKYSFHQYELNHIKLYIFAYLLLSLALFISLGLHEAGHWASNREDFFKNSGLIASLFVMLVLASKFLLFSSVLQKFVLKIWSTKTTVVFIAFFGVLDVLLTGNRIMFLMILMALTYLLFFKYGYKVFLFLVLVLPFGFALSIYRHVRNDLYLEGIPSLELIIELFHKVIESQNFTIVNSLLAIVESINFNVLYGLFSFINTENTLYGSSIIKPFVMFIPRSVWPEKPLTITVEAAHIFAPHMEGLSLVTTIIGELHMNFYIFGIFLLPIYLFLLEKIIMFFTKDTAFLGALAFMFGIMFFRMPFADTFITLLIIALFALTVKVVSNNLFRSKY